MRSRDLPTLDPMAGGRVCKRSWWGYRCFPQADPHPTFTIKRIVNAFRQYHLLRGGIRWLQCSAGDPLAPGSGIRISRIGEDWLENITGLLHRWQDGDLLAREKLCEVLYTDLLRVARDRLSKHGGNTLQPAALVNESLMRLLDGEPGYKDRAHFVSVAALRMRAVLVDHARARAASKRGGDIELLTLSHADGASGAQDMTHEVLALHEALNRLADVEPRAASAIELTYFGGMTRDEIALILGISLPTVDRDLRFARAWLNRQLS